VVRLLLDKGANKEAGNKVGTECAGTAAARRRLLSSTHVLSCLPEID
jgi:hypothetical protein